MNIFKKYVIIGLLLLASITCPAPVFNNQFTTNPAASLPPTNQLAVKNVVNVFTESNNFTGGLHVLGTNVIVNTSDSIRLGNIGITNSALRSAGWSITNNGTTAVFTSPSGEINLAAVGAVRIAGGSGSVVAQNSYSQLWGDRGGNSSMDVQANNTKYMRLTTTSATTPELILTNGQVRAISNFTAQAYSGYRNMTTAPVSNTFVLMFGMTGASVTTNYITAPVNGVLTTYWTTNGSTIHSRPAVDVNKSPYYVQRSQSLRDYSGGIGTIGVAPYTSVRGVAYNGQVYGVVSVDPTPFREAAIAAGSGWTNIILTYTIVSTNAYASFSMGGNLPAIMTNNPMGLGVGLSGYGSTINMTETTNVYECKTYWVIPYSVMTNMVNIDAYTYGSGGWSGTNKWLVGQIKIENAP